jgi:hypothetical protein
VEKQSCTIFFRYATPHRASFLNVLREMETWALGRIVGFASYVTLDKFQTSNKKWFVVHIADIASTSIILDRAFQFDKHSI